MKVTGVDIHFHQDSKGDREFGPVYGSIPLPDTLPINDGMTQAMPCRRELVEVRKKHERMAAAYEIAIWYLLAANQELGERTKHRDQLEAELNNFDERLEKLDWAYESLKAENEALKAVLSRAREVANENGVTMRDFAKQLGITPTQLSQWTSESVTQDPDLKD